MKVLSALLMFVFVNYSVQQNPQAPQTDNPANLPIFHNAEDECLEELHLNPKELFEHMFADIAVADLIGYVTDNDQNFKCFLKCVFVKEGAMKESGELLVDPIIAYLTASIDEEKATKAVGKCQKTTETDPCQIAFDLFFCIYIETHIFL